MVERLAGKMKAGSLRRVLLSACCAAAMACKDDSPSRVCMPESELDPDEWQQASAEEAGVAPSELDAAIAAHLAAPDHGIDSVVVIRHGKLVTTADCIVVNQEPMAVAEPHGVEPGTGVGQVGNPDLSPGYSIVP